MGYVHAESFVPFRRIRASFAFFLRSKGQKTGFLWENDGTRDIFIVYFVLFRRIRSPPPVRRSSAVFPSPAPVPPIVVLIVYCA